MNKGLIILALETLREQVECGTVWECEVETLEGMVRLDLINEELYKCTHLVILQLISQSNLLSKFLCTAPT